MNSWINSWAAKKEPFQQYCKAQQKKYLSSLKDPRSLQKRVLDNILKVTQGSRFALGHHLSNVTDKKTLIKHVPIRTYDQYISWIDSEIRAKGGVLSQSPLVRLLKTSGSSGDSKKIPYTVDWMENYRVPALGILWAKYLEAAPEILSHPFAVLDTQTIREPIKDHINHIPYQSITNRHPLINSQDWDLPWYDAPWFSPDVPGGYDGRMYCRLRYFIGQDLRAITAINPSTLIAMHYHLVNNWSQLIKDIHNGTLFNQRIAEPNPALASFLSKIDISASDSLKRIWPKLSLVTCWTSASAELYVPQLEKLFPHTRILPFMTCGTEGVVTLPVDDGVFPLALNQGFYEFLPAEMDIEKLIKEDYRGETLSFDQLDLGKEYHLIMTQANGLYRLAIGDIYKVVGFYQSVPRIVFSRRNGTFPSFTGEKITETQMLSALQNSSQQCGLRTGLYACFPVWSEMPYYKLLIEKSEGLTLERSPENQILANKIDRKLFELNEEYASKRSTGRLGPIEVVFIKEGVISKYLEKQKLNVKSNPTQIKYKPFQTEAHVYDALVGG